MVGAVDNVDKSSFNRADRVEIVAEKLVDLFGSRQGYRFYCKIAYELTEEQIWNNYNTAKKAKASSPHKIRSIGGLFNWLCRRDMEGLRK